MPLGGTCNQTCWQAEACQSFLPPLLLLLPYHTVRHRSEYTVPVFIAILQMLVANMSRCSSADMCGLTGARPSISSKKMMDGWAFWASSNSSLNWRSASPTHLDRTSAPLRMKKDTLVPALLAVAANARATNVLPVPVHEHSNHSFVHSLIHPFIKSFIHSFMHPFFDHSFNDGLLHQLIRVHLPTTRLQQCPHI